MVQIIPAILATSEEDYRKDIYRVKRAESFREGWVHIDFMDNKFVPSESIRPETVAKYPLNLQKEAHLMVAHPKDWIDKLIDSGFERVIFHLESEDDTTEVIEYIKSKGLEVGLALKDNTELEKLDLFIDKIDVVMLMGVDPGQQGQEFISHSVDKMKELKSKEWKVRIGIDGGVKDTNIGKIVEAGSDFVVVGSYLLQDDIDENLENLWEALRLRSG